MAKRFGFFNSINGDRKYLATDISQAFDVAVTTGLQAIPDSFKVVPNDGMTVKMLPGGCMIYGAFCVDNEDEIIELDVADGESNRIDRIVVRYDRFERSIKTVVIKGTPALNPTPPTPLRNENQFDLVLADIYVAKAATEITESNITDMRKSDLCGFIGVKGAVSQIDFDAHLAESANKAHGGFKGGLITIDSHRSIPNDTETAIVWGLTRYNIGGIGSDTQTWTKLIVPRGVNKVIVKASVMWRTTSTGYRRVWFKKNGDIFAGSSMAELAVGDGILVASLETPVLPVNEGDYFQVYAKQNTGSAKDILKDPRTWFALEVIE